MRVPLKVRLDFNSSMVRLRDIKGYADTYIELAFQFQYGAIEGLPAAAMAKGIILFQFQYGAIEGFPVVHGLQLDAIFQFQYGAIEGAR